MVRGSRGTRFTVPTLVRLLARLAEADVPESNPAFTEGLSDWLGWTDAIALSAALDGRPGKPAEAPSGTPLDPVAAERELFRLRSALADPIADDLAVAAMARGAPADVGAGFSTLRRRYSARQQAMETGIGALRGRLREGLSSASPALARLAALDAVMEQVLGAQERALLSTVPVWLDRHFERLRRAHEDAPHAEGEEPDGPDTPSRSAAWLDVFCKDMQTVMLAELDVRMQPVEGLLDAFRMRQRGRHD